MSLSTPMAPITAPSASRSAEALRLVGITSPVAARGLRRALRVTPRSTTSRRAAVNSRVSSSLMKRESDCSTTSSRRKPSNWETASLASRIFPSRSETNTGSGAFLMMMSATRTSWAGAPAVLAERAPSRRVLTEAFRTFLATAFLQIPFGRCLGGCGSHCARSSACRQILRLVPAERRRSRTYRAVGYTTAPVLFTGWAHKRDVRLQVHRPRNAERHSGRPPRKLAADPDDRIADPSMQQLGLKRLRSCATVREEYLLIRPWEEGVIAPRLGVPLAALAVAGGGRSSLKGLSRAVLQVRRPSRRKREPPVKPPRRDLEEVL